MQRPLPPNHFRHPPQADSFLREASTSDSSYNNSIRKIIGARELLEQETQNIVFIFCDSTLYCTVIEESALEG